jgi:alcohol dehydrogenase
MNASGFTRDVVTVLSKEAIPSQDQMKAAYYLMHGNETVIEVNDRVSRPIVRDRQLLIKVTATALNPVDIKLREHNVPQLVLPLPKIIGSDLSGTVVEKGPLASEKFKVGDKVIAMMPHVGSGWGSACEFAAVEEDHLAPAPSNVSPVEAASLPLISLTVVQSIKPFVDACGGQTSGKSVLVQAGSGGLGSFAVQYCKKELGMKVYTSCSGENADFVRSLGADVVIDYKTQKFEEVAEGMDLVFDPMAYMYEERTFKSKVLKSVSIQAYRSPQQ